jgi:hypothetical protein
MPSSRKVKLSTVGAGLPLGKKAIEKGCFFSLVIYFSGQKHRVFERSDKYVRLK